ncbi:hypothetical protein ACQRIU_007004 [Beauveria bassiana]
MALHQPDKSWPPLSPSSTLSTPSTSSSEPCQRTSSPVCQFTLRGWSISGSYAAPWRKHQHVLRVSIQRNILGKCMHWLVTTILPKKLALAFLPVAWSLPTTVVVKKLKPNSDDEFTNELRMYEKLKSLQDLEHVYELDYDPGHAIQLGRAAILERWNQFREQYEEYGEIEM